MFLSYYIQLAVWPYLNVDDDDDDQLTMTKDLPCIIAKLDEISTPKKYCTAMYYD